VYAGRTEHLAQQLQAPFEWQPMSVHVVDPPAHLATLGLVPIHNKSASGALLYQSYIDPVMISVGTSETGLLPA